VELMDCRSDIAHLQELVARLTPTDAELINRLEQSRLRLGFALAGVHRPRADHLVGDGEQPVPTPPTLPAAT
jgi:hypothetical protein